MTTTIKKGLRNVTRKKPPANKRTALGLKETTKPIINLLLVGSLQGRVKRLYIAWPPDVRIQNDHLHSHRNDSHK